MAEMVGSAFVQEAVSRAVSFVLGKREEAASQGHLMKRLEMAANELERALERSAKLVITDVSLLQRRNRLIKPAYIEAMELLEMHRQQQSVLPAAGGQEDHQLVSRGQKKRKLWMVFRANTQDVVPVEAPSSAGGGLDMAVVQRLEQSADWGRELVRDVESACSLWSNNLCSNPVARHLFQGRNLSCLLVQGNQRRSVRISPLRSEERGVEVVLWYSYDEHDSTPMGGKTFILILILRPSESVDIVGVAIKGLEYLASQFMLGTESAVGELTLLPTLLQGLAPSPVPWEVDPIGWIHSWCARLYRPDPACCGASRLGLCSRNNNVSSELSHVFPEEIRPNGSDYQRGTALKISSGI
ncbi:hypothetical protein U9M48_011541 [Paspalum notatum var. saurae]|uniref:Rx N-terminal domain-containing protein n=1 Tax=Paspalum notatum var. saurae TaxID=547442 RepID=A0AAQ3SW09_PASNO